MGVERSRKAAKDTRAQRKHWTNQGQCLFSSLWCQHCSGISGAELRFKFRLYLPVCQSLPLRDYLCYPKLMQDLENAGFKLFTQMHWGQQKGWKKYQRAGCCTVKHQVWWDLEQFVPLIKVTPSTCLPSLPLWLAAFWIFSLVLLNTYIADFMLTFLFSEPSHVENIWQMNHLNIESSWHFFFPRCCS